MHVSITLTSILGQQIVWNFIKKLYKSRGISFKKPSFGDQLGYALTKKVRKGDKEEHRFQKIIVSEVMYSV